MQHNSRLGQYSPVVSESMKPGYRGPEGPSETPAAIDSKEAGGGLEGSTGKRRGGDGTRRAPAPAELELETGDV
jgi:hypothetical protein